jgi:hypothetical protein
MVGNLRGLNEHLLNVTIVVALYVLSFQLVTYLIDPIQKTFLHVEYASLLFLPHGIRVVVTILYGARNGFVYLLIASGFILLLTDEGIKTDLTVLLQTLASAGCAPLAMLLLGFGFGSKSLSLDAVTSKTWRALLMLIILSSLLNGIMQTAAIQLGNTGIGDVLLSLRYIVGDILGSIVVFALASYALRRAL